MKSRLCAAVLISAFSWQTAHACKMSALAYSSMTLKGVLQSATQKFDAMGQGHFIVRSVSVVEPGSGHSHVLEVVDTGTHECWRHFYTVNITASCKLEIAALESVGTCDQPKPTPPPVEPQP